MQLFSFTGVEAKKGQVCLIQYSQHWSSCLAYRKPAPDKFCFYWMNPSLQNRKRMSRDRTGFLKVTELPAAGQQFHSGLSSFLELGVPTITCCGQGRQHTKGSLGWEQSLEERGREGKQAIPGRWGQLLYLRLWTTNKQGNRKEVIHGNAPETGTESRKRGTEAAQRLGNKYKTDKKLKGRDPKLPHTLV